MPISVEDRPSICTSVCDFPGCYITEISEAYPESDLVQRIPNDWYLVWVSKIEIPSKMSNTSLPGKCLVFCSVHGKQMFP